MFEIFDKERTGYIHRYDYQSILDQVQAPMPEEIGETVSFGEFVKHMMALEKEREAPLPYRSRTELQVRSLKKSRVNSVKSLIEHDPMGLA